MNWVELRGKPNKRENCDGSKLKNVEEAILSGSWVFIKYSMDHEDFVLTLRCWIIVFNWKRFRFPSECDGSKQSKQTTRSSQLNYIFLFTGPHLPSLVETVLCYASTKPRDCVRVQASRMLDSWDQTIEEKRLELMGKWSLNRMVTKVSLAKRRMVRKLPRNSQCRDWLKKFARNFISHERALWSDKHLMRKQNFSLMEIFEIQLTVHQHHNWLSRRHMQRYFDGCLARKVHEGNFHLSMAHKPSDNARQTFFFRSYWEYKIMFQCHHEGDCLEEVQSSSKNIFPFSRSLTFVSSTR